MNFNSKGNIRDTDIDTNSDQDSSSITNSDAESWTEDDGGRTDTPSWKTTDNDDSGFDDSGDSPYIYQSRGRADLLPVEDSDSD
jgi:hypothetical protein